MFVRYLITSLAIISFSICHAKNYVSHRKVTDIICSGNASIHIDGKEEMLHESNSTDLFVDDGVMLISNGNWHFNLPKKLNSISIHDSCRLKTKHWNGHIKNLVHDSKNDTVMDGFFNINKILQTGNGRLVIYWINDGDDLVATVESGKTYLAGQVKRLILKTTGKSHFNGQHLVSRRVLLKSSDQSTVQVHPVHALTVFSIDQSHVGYVRPVSYSNLSSKDQSSIVMEPFRQD